MNPNHYTGDLHSFKDFAQLREDALSRRAAQHRDARGATTAASPARAHLAAFLRRSADRLAPECEAPDYPAGHSFGGI
jgi:hypothetical protein